MPAERTVYHGTLRDEKLVAQYHLADVLLLPSTGKTESFGMVLVEAMACGVPVIASNIGGIPTVISDGIDGLLVPTANVQALTEAIASVLEHPAQADQLADQAYHKVLRRFTWQKSVQHYLDIVAAAQTHVSTIVHVAGYYPPHLGGMETVAQALAENLASRNYDVQVLTSSVDQPTPPPATPQNLHIHRFKAFEFAHTPIAFGFIPAIFRIPKSSIVHLHLAQAMYPEWVWLMCKIRRIPYVVHFHLDLMPSGTLGRLFVVYKAVVLKFVIRQANKVVVFSSEQKQFIYETYK